MVEVGFDEAVLLLRRGIVALSAAGVRGGRVVVIVGPFGEVICELKSRQIGRGVFKVDDDKLLVFILRLQKRRLLVVGPNAEDVAVLCLCRGVSKS